jgi:hypothetical protein
VSQAIHTAHDIDGAVVESSAAGVPVSARLTAWGPFVGTAVGIAALAAANGGYFAPSWGWGALVLTWTCVLALAFGTGQRVSRLEAVALTAMAGLVGWIALSALWSESGLESLREAQRALVYLAGLGAALLALRSRDVGGLLGGLLAGVSIVAVYSLATRLVPDRLGTFDPVAGYRLAEPVGYWNGLGILTVLGALLALGFAARARRPLVRAMAAASLVVLLPTLYFSFSRGAWIALGLGLVTAVVLDARRLQLVTTVLLAAPGPLGAVLLAAHSDALTRQEAALGGAAREGHRFALAVVLLAAATGGLVLGLAFLERRVRTPRKARRAYAGVLVVAVAAALTTFFAVYGSPGTIAHRAYEAFRAPPPEIAGDLNSRLFSFSGNGRATQWELAWADHEDHPALGSGAGTYERYWLAGRSLPGKVRDAHSLYLETLAELGPVGLSLLGFALGAPLVAAFRARRRGLISAACGAYVAYLAHAAVDWDWELTAVTLAALLCGAGLLLTARGEGGTLLAAWQRVGLAGLTLALAGIAAIGLLGASALAASAEAAKHGDWPDAQAQARKAIRWTPYSAVPWQALGRAQLASGDLEGATASFRTALAKDAGNWELWLDLARATEGKTQAGALATAARLNPLSPEIAELRAELQVETPPADEEL